MISNLHDIKPTTIFSDMVLANIWAIQQDNRNSTILKIRINLNYGSAQKTRDDGISGPIERIDGGYNDWHRWYIENERLNLWRHAGSPLPDLSNIEVGRW